jgi:hypothetical protein
MNRKNKMSMLAGLIFAAAAIFYYDAAGLSFPGSKASQFASKTYSPLPVENPELQRWKLDVSRRTEYKSNGRDLFSVVLPPPPRKVPDKVPDPVPQVPSEPPPPSLPPNMKYFGFGVVPNGTSKRAFLTDGEGVTIVAEGDTLLGRFRILRIGNNALEFEEMGSGRHGSAPLEEQAAPSNPQ